MGVVLLQRPAQWNCIKAPTLYKFIREDSQISAVNNDAGMASLFVNGVDLTATGTDFVHNGDQLYVDSILKGIYTVTAVSFSGGGTNIKLDVLYPGATGVGWFNNHTVRANYKLSVELWDADNNKKFFDDAIAYSPTPTDRINVDVQAIASLLTAEVEFFFAGALDPWMFTAGNLKKSRRFYIKYTEVWIGSGNGPADDSANTLSAVYCGTKARFASDLAGITGMDPWLEMFDRPKLFDGRYMSMSYYGVPVDTCIVCERYLADGTQLSRRVIAASQYMVSVSISRQINEMLLKISLAQVAVKILSPNTSWIDIAGVTTKTATRVTLSGAGSQLSKSYQPAAVPLNASIQFDVIHNIAAPAGSRTFTWRLETSGGTVLDTETFNYTLLGGHAEHISLQAIGSAADRLTLEMQYTSGGATSVFVDLTIDQPLVDGAAISLVKEIDVIEKEDRRITLGWTNERGGDEFFTFKFNQSYGFTYPNNEKVTRITVYGEDLSLNEFEVINQIFSIGEVYRPAVAEFDGSQKGDKKRIGQQVYAQLVTGDLLEVIVVPSDAYTQSKQTLHRLDITFELPVGYKLNDLFL
jgi:hypothetical protein